MSTTEPTPELQELADATRQAMPYWIEFCRGRSDDAAQATVRVWAAIEVVLGTPPQQVTNVQTVTTDTDGQTTVERWTLTHAIWCPTPVWPTAPSGPALPACQTCYARVTPAVVGS